MLKLSKLDADTVSYVCDWLCIRDALFVCLCFEKKNKVAIALYHVECFVSQLRWFKNKRSVHVIGKGSLLESDQLHTCRNIQDFSVSGMSNLQCMIGMNLSSLTLYNVDHEEWESIVPCMRNLSYLSIDTERPVLLLCSLRLTTLVYKTRLEFKIELDLPQLNRFEVSCKVKTEECADLLFLHSHLLCECEFDWHILPRILLFEHCKKLNVHGFPVDLNRMNQCKLRFFECDYFFLNCKLDWPRLTVLHLGVIDQHQLECVAGSLPILEQLKLGHYLSIRKLNLNCLYQRLSKLTLQNIRFEGTLFATHLKCIKVVSGDFGQLKDTLHVKWSKGRGMLPAVPPNLETFTVSECEFENEWVF